ncbi:MULTISPECIES: hypothetical protein [unclassified Arthrobacter]|uniref:hypothetical protein n=1 Tax=unclassified Arthrobacter TaxID=235627 RepID=UPI00159E23AD|nr:MULTISPECIES: hypothetical protein [unclassified Arthrobacter]MCQ9163800.1 hypothetical protein [Arthrobacter sp. STN4]NVM99415.1 hypothetical protein [Arthrobacter sp. SDTb3-6]
MDDYGFVDDDGSTEGPDSGDGFPDGGTDDVDRQFTALTAGMMMPGPNECLVCFLMRAKEFLLPDGFAMVARFRECSAPRATNTEYRLINLGAYNDRAVLRRAAMVNPAVWAPECCPRCGLPYAVPDCLGVRRGSTQPCKLWRWRDDLARERFLVAWQSYIDRCG